jgi:hypothetical protein
MASITTKTYGDALAAARSSDGGFALAHGGPSETEPTALAALALDDPVARAWLARAQRSDGGFAAVDGRPESPSVAALAALALSDQRRSARALTHALANRAPTVGDYGNEDGDGRNGWGWTNDTYSWVEPTARVLLAVKALRPADSVSRSEALRIVRQRQCVDGGWNYGSTVLQGVELSGFAQTTAVTLMALQGEDLSLVDPALRFLRSQWRNEPGGLTLAQTAVALDLHDADGVAEVRDAMDVAYRKTAFLGNLLTLAWATLATGPSQRLDRLRSAG